MKKAGIVLSKKENNQVVTNMYLDTICKIMEQCDFKSYKDPDLSTFDKNKDYLIVDTCKTAFEYFFKGYKNIIVWVQGVVPEEAIMIGYHHYRYYAHSFIENFVLKKAKLLFMVSSAMLNHYEEKYNLTLKNKVFIMPCYNENKIDEQSFLSKDKYNKNTFLYAGSLQEWQCFAQTIKVYKEIEDEINDAKLIVYTDEQTKALKIIRENKINNFYIGYEAPDKLGAKIKNIKYGFVLRKDDVVNNVATPTKLSNYISHGIIPIYSPCLKSFDAYNSKYPLALSFDLSNQDRDLPRLIKDIRKDVNSEYVKTWCKKVFDSYYNQEEYIRKAALKMELLLNNNIG